MRKAVDLVVEHAKPIPLDTAAAREKLWTPEKEAAERPAGRDLDAGLLSGRSPAERSMLARLARP